MYKLFLCLRYLSRRIIAWFAMGAVGLCVFMMLIAVSVMDGFVNKIEVAAKGLFGDVVVDTPNLNGISYYDEFIAELKRRMPDKIEEASPFIMTYGILETRFRDYNDTRWTVQVVGIRLPERVRVSSFGEGLSYQQGITAPTFDPPVSLLLERLKPIQDETCQLARKAVQDVLPESQRSLASGMNPEEIYFRWGDAVPPETNSLLKKLLIAYRRQNISERVLHQAEPLAPQMSQLWHELQKAEANGTATQPAASQPTTNTGLDVQTTKGDVMREELQQLSRRAGRVYKGMTPDDDVYEPFEWPQYHAIVGLGLPGFMFRTHEGKVVRTAAPGTDFSLTLVPLGERSTSGMGYQPIKQIFTMVDESRTDVSTIDSNVVYVPFETLQELNKMGPVTDSDGKVVRPARTNQIHIKVKESFIKARQEQNNRLAVMLGMAPRQRDALEDVAAEVETVWNEFHNDPRYAAVAGDTSVYAQSWRERQHDLVGQIQSQRTLVVIMFGIISSVAVVLILVIFYMIVMQKTKDIGVIKSLGGSGFGVAAIFLGYGAATGLVGSVIGTIGGWLVVRNINPIHDWIGRTFGFTVWTRERFMFDQIPNEVQLSTAISIMVAAVLAGLIGALIPAIKASWMQPVEALRYE